MLKHFDLPLTFHTAICSAICSVKARVQPKEMIEIILLLFISVTLIKTSPLFDLWVLNPLLYVPKQAGQPWPRVDRSTNVFLLL